MALPIIPSSILNWGKRFSEGIQEKPPEPTTGAPLTPEEEQQISDELQDDPLFTKEENAALRKAEKEAEAKRKKDEEDIAAADRYGEMMAEKDPEKLKKNQESGYQFNPEQEKIVWKYEREKPATRKVGDFLSRAGEAFQQAAVELPVGAYKGLKYTVFDPIGAMDATPEEEAKVLEKAGQTARSFGSGVAGGLEDIVYELPKTVYKGGTPVTDWAKELVGAQTEEESYQNFLKRQVARKEFAADEEAMPERTSALLAKGAGALGDVGLLDKQFSKDLEQQLKERALTKDQMVPEVATLGDIFAPDIPLMGRMSKLTAKATGKVGEGVLKGLTGVQVGERRIVAPAVEAVGYGGRRLGEKTNEYSAKIDRAISGSDDWIFRNAVGKTSNFLGKISGGVEAFGRFGTDIGRVLDTGMAGRKGVAERLGELPTQGRLANVLFGDASQGLRKKIGELSPVEAAAEAEKNAEKMANRSRQGLARARAVDSASRLGQYYANAGINGAAVQVMLGLPNMETWGDVGEATGYGAGMGFVLGSNPKSLFVDRVRADQRKAAEGDIGRMMEGLDETTKARLKSLSDPATFVAQLTKRKDSVQSRVDLLKDIVNSAKKRTFGDVTITPRDAQAEIDHLEGVVMPKIDSDIKSAAKTNPQTQKEIEFIINKEFMDSLGNLKTVSDAAGLGDVDVRMLGTEEIKAALDEMYKSQKEAAAETIAILGGEENLSPEDKKLLDDALAFEGFLEGEKENLSGQRGFALTPAKDRTQPGWWQSGHPVSKPTIIMNSDELKNSRGLDIASVMRHEMFHGLLQFGEVQDMMKDHTDVLFDQYITDDQGNQEKSDGIISDEKLRQMADKYSAKYNPLEKGMWRSMFETDGDLLNAIKEEFLAEAFTQSGGATGMTSNVEDSVVESVLDYARAQNASSTLGKIRDSLGKMGINVDNSGRSNVLESEIPSQAIALMRQFRRTLRDYNGTLNQIGQAELNAPGSIPLTKIASSKALFNRYKDADFWEREAATTVTAPDGTVLSEEVLPKSAQDKLVTGEWTVQGGKLVPVDPEYSAVVPKALSSMAKGKPDGTKIVAGVRIARNPDGTPRILSKAAVEAVARKRNDLIKQAIDTAPEDGTPNRLKDTGNGNYRGVMSPSQLIAVSQIPDIVLPQRMKVLIRKINEMLLRGDGSRFNTEYQAALRGGQYRGMAPRFSDDAPIGFQFSKDGNFLVTTVSVTRLQNKLNAWAKEMPGRLALWNGSKYDFWADFVKVLDNQKKNIPGQTDLDADPAIAEEKKNVVNDLLNLYNKDTVDTNPSRTKLKQKRGQDSRDRTIVSRRLDRMLRLDENNAEKLPINYGKVIANALPQAEFNFGDPTPGTKRFYQDFEILNKASGEYAGQPIRISVQAKTAEEAEQMISQTPDYQRYNAAYRFNSIGKPYSAPDPSERMTPEEFAAMKSNAGLGPSSKALPAWEEEGDAMASIVNPSTKYLPKSDQDFYSRLQQGIAASQQKTFSPEQAKALAAKSTNQEELKWSGIDQAIDNIAQENNGKVPKQSLLDYMASAGNVQFEEVVLDETGVSPEKRKLSDQFDEINNRASAVWSDAVSKHGEDERYWPEEVLQEWYDLQDLLVDIEEKRNGIKDSGESAKYGEKGMNKVLPGGKNYREVVMTMPTKTEDELAEEILKKAGLVLGKSGNNRWTRDKNGFLVYPSDADVDLIKGGSRMATPEEDTAIKAAREVKAPEIYTSSHFRNTPNYVAHYRTDERTDSEGKEGLFIEEIQSDRHQKGRKQGYKGEEKPIDTTGWTAKRTQPTYSDYGDNPWSVRDPNGQFRLAHSDLTEEEAIRSVAEKSRTEGSVADAPFRKDWPLQMFKRALRDAVADGKDWIGWTDGATQADRYDLSRHVDEIVYWPREGGKFNVTAKSKSQQDVDLGSDILPEQLSDIIGKELAEKIIAGEGTKRDLGGYSLSGGDLKVGGEGMKGFYDTMLPKEVGKYIGKMDGKVEKSVIGSNPSDVAPNLKSFTDLDWDSFSGAEEFPSGDRPLIGEVRMHHINTDKTFTIISDRNGFQILDEEGENFNLSEEFQTSEEAQNYLSENFANGTFHIKLTGQNRGEYFTEPQTTEFDYWKINITPQMRETVLKQGQPKFLPKAEQQQQDVRAPKERGLQFLKYAEEEEERPAPLSSLMLN